MSTRIKYKNGTTFSDIVLDVGNGGTGATTPKNARVGLGMRQLWTGSCSHGGNIPITEDVITQYQLLCCITKINNQKVPIFVNFDSSNFVGCGGGKAYNLNYLAFFEIVLFVNTSNLTLRCVTMVTPQQSLGEYLKFGAGGGDSIYEI